MDFPARRVTWVISWAFIFRTLYDLCFKIVSFSCHAKSPWEKLISRRAGCAHVASSSTFVLSCTFGLRLQPFSTVSERNVCLVEALDPCPWYGSGELLAWACGMQDLKKYVLPGALGDGGLFSVCYSCRLIANSVFQCFFMFLQSKFAVSGFPARQVSRYDHCLLKCFRYSFFLHRCIHRCSCALARFQLSR